MTLRLIHFFTTILLCSLATAQNIKTQEEYENLKKAYFPKKEKQIKIMKENWGMYFKENVASVVDRNSQDFLFEIKLDSYGSVYPDTEILNVITRSQFEGPKRRYSGLRSHSFLRQFRIDDGRIAQAATKTDKPELYHTLLKLSKNGDVSEDRFFDLWDSVHTSDLITKLNQRVEKDSFERVIFFVPGYNVPYSLAVLQAIAFYHIVNDTLRCLKEKTLIVPVYWPSNNSKNNQLSQEEFTTENIKKFRSNGKLFLRYSNRCYYAAITLRTILNSLSPNVKVDLVSHSLGATIVTSCLINTHSKLHYPYFSKLREIADSIELVLSAKKEDFKGKDELGFDILHRLYSVPIPDRKINVFLSAPAIPGYNTFVDIDPNYMENKRFYSTINYQDEMVTKREIRNQVKKRIHKDIKAINAHRLSATTLGCNAKCDAYCTQSYYNTRVENPVAFTTREVGNDWDHDIFTYMRAKGYQAFLKEFLRLK